MRTIEQESYFAERERAIVTLYNTVRRIREKLDFEAERFFQVDEETTALLQAYTPTQLALLQLMKEEKEESEVNGDE